MTDQLPIPYDKPKLLPACHVDRYQLKCNACNHRLRTRVPSSYYEPMYPYCPWCGAPISVEAQELERRKRGDDTRRL